MNERYLRKAASIAAFLLIVGFPTLDAIASISVSPVRVDLSDEHTKDVVRVSNLEEITKSYQVEIVAWSQSDERREIYAPTEQLLVVPPPDQYRLERSEPATVHLNKVLDWYKDDFGGDEGVLRFLLSYLPEGDAAYIREHGPAKIKHPDYDWTLNDTAVFSAQRP